MLEFIEKKKNILKKKKKIYIRIFQLQMQILVKTTTTNWILVILLLTHCSVDAVSYIWRSLLSSGFYSVYRSDCKCHSGPSGHCLVWNEHYKVSLFRSHVWVCFVHLLTNILKKNSIINLIIYGNFIIIKINSKL